MKESERIRLEIEALTTEYDELSRSLVMDNPQRTAENHGQLWNDFWENHGRGLKDRIDLLKLAQNVELNREIDIGDGVTMYLWSDAHACTVIAKTAKTLTIQRDKASLDPNFKPEWIPGGFAAHCTNAEDQEWTYEPDPNGEIIKCRWSEKRGRWQTGSDGSIRIGRGRHEYYDYNF